MILEFWSLFKRQGKANEASADRIAHRSTYEIQLLRRTPDQIRPRWKELTSIHHPTIPRHRSFSSLCQARQKKQLTFDLSEDFRDQRNIIDYRSRFLSSSRSSR